MAEDPSASSTAQLFFFAFYPWVKSLCPQLAFLPPRATPTHPAETQITRFAGTSSPSFEIL